MSPSLPMAESSSLESEIPAELRAELGRYMSNSLAPSTQSNLRTALNHFDRFTRTLPSRTPLQQPRWEGDLQAALHNEMTFMLFVIWLVRDGTRQASTAMNYCSLARTHLGSLAGFPLASRSPRWKKLIRAVRKTHRRERKECRPLRMAHLRRAYYGAYAAQTVESVNRWAAIVCGIHLLARPREIANLRRSHLSFKSTPMPHAVILLKPLKKGPEQEPVPMLIAQGDGSSTDAYAILTQLVTIDPVLDHLASSTPLFRDARRHAPSNATLTQWVQGVANAAGEGVDTRFFAGRSLRVGGATELHAAGANELTIALLGRWSSDCARLYTRASQGQVLSLSRAMGSAPDDPALEQVFEGYVQTARR